MTCTLCDGLQFSVVYNDNHIGEESPCKCKLDKRFKELVEPWIYQSIPAKTNYYAGMSETNTILVRSEGDQARLLHTAFRNFFDNKAGRYIHKYTNEDELLKFPFQKDENGGQADNPFLNTHRVLLRLGLNYKANTDFQNDVIFKFIKHRVDKGLVTWIIRDKPLTKSSFDYSERLEALIQNSFTPIILK